MPYVLGETTEKQDSVRFVFAFCDASEYVRM